MADNLTVLETVGPVLTKTYKADGTTEAYGDAASFKVAQVSVSSITDLATLLGKLHKKPKRCLIHGAPKPEAEREPGKVAGTWLRSNVNFDDQPLHTFLIDVDGFEPFASDPVREPAEAVQEYLQSCLPPEFQRASFYWHLSSSAGMPGKESKLKVHLWFWLKTPYTCAQLTEWANVVGTVVDRAVYRKVQVRYTADPLFEEGRIDPVPVRAGLHRGETDELDLVINEALLAQAREQGGGTGGDDMKLKDPSEKDGLIGLFHRTFTPEEVLLQHLEGEFEQATERRYTWHNGGGTPEGVWVHSDGMHVGSSHNTWPIDGIANLWDVVRVFKFGHLDETEDDFERLAMDDVGHRPSDKAMLEWAGALPELQAKLVEEGDALLLDFVRQIEAAPSPRVIEDVIAPRIRQETGLAVVDLERLAATIKRRVQLLSGGANLPIAQARRMVTPRRSEMAADAPDWARDWVWVSSLDKFTHVDTKEQVSITSFNAKYDRYMARYADDNGSVPKASDMITKQWQVEVVSSMEYNPGAGLFFSRDNLSVMNSYRPDLLPEVPDKLSEAHLEAIATLQQHLDLLVPDAREQGLFLDFMAYCVQHPGRKIRWAPLIIGMEGDGKSFFIGMMSVVLGHRNVRILNNSTLESNFTGWATGQSFIGVEELKLHNHNKLDIYNNLKPIISNDFIEIHAKGKDPVNLPNFCNILALSNFEDAAPVSENDRRLFFLKSPFYGTSAEILANAIKDKTGLTPGEFYAKLFDHGVKKYPGAFRKWLLDREIGAEFNPDGRAPETTMRTLAVALARSEAEVAACAVLERGGVGIYPGLVTTKSLTGAIKDACGLEVRTQVVSNLLSKLGWSRWVSPTGKTEVKWQGWPHIFYFKGSKPEHPGQLANTLEEQRQAAEVDDDFAD